MITVRDAREGDLDLVVRVMLDASRSQLPVGVWEYLYGYDEHAALAFLRELAVGQRVHPFHLSLFTIAEVDGAPAAAMCGYDPTTQGFEQFDLARAAALPAHPMPIGAAENERRLELFLGGVASSPVERPWIIENVACLPAFRGRGAVDALLHTQVERGRGRGFADAQITLFLENDRAHRAYARAGFSTVGEQRSDGWQRELGCPGEEVMLRSLR